MKVRPLCKELQQKAIDELNEDPTRTEEDLNYIREWLKKQPHLKIRDEDQWLLSFLRGCKFSLERTKEKLDTYCTMKTIIPEFFDNRDPMRPEIQEILSAGLCLPLPKGDDPTDTRHLLLRNGNYEAGKFNISEVFKVNMMILDILVNEEDQFVICGEHIFQDFSHVTMNHAAAASPAVAKKSMTCFQDAYPIRAKGLHFFNIPTFFEIVFALFKPFMNEKSHSRVKIYSKAHEEEVFKFVPSSIVPKEYGGDGPSLSELTTFWKKKVESYRDWFLEDAKYKSDESKRPGKPKTTTEVFGIEGSFRKLNVD